MKPSNNKEIIRRFVEEIENTGDVSNIQEFIAEDYTEVYEGVPHRIGIQGAIDHVLGVRRVYPDLKLTIENQISENEWVVTTYSVTGTFENEWFGMKPTGKPITYRSEGDDFSQEMSEYDKMILPVTGPSFSVRNSIPSCFPRNFRGSLTGTASKLISVCSGNISNSGP